jgi:crossover junction endodeoxyribonuclease RuvC
MRVLGIDPGSRTTGYGVIELDGSALRRVTGGVIRVSRGSFAARLARIHAEITGIIAEIRPHSVALEAVFTARNPRSALLLGQARGAALAACGQSGLETAEYAPSQVKAAVTGYGAADKSQVQQMVQRLLGLRGRQPVDESDALAVAICHAHTRRVLGALQPTPLRVSEPRAERA